MPGQPTYEQLEQRIEELEEVEFERKKTEIRLQAREAFLSALIDAIPIPVFYKDRAGKYLGFNRAFEMFFGETRGRLIGKSVFDINPPELAEIYHAKDDELFVGGGIQQYESQVKNARGELRNVIFNKSVYTDTKGTVNGLIGTILDLTERKLAEKALRHSEAQKKAILDASVSSIRYVDKAMKIIWANQTMATRLGMPQEDLVGQTCHKLFIGRDTPCEGCPTVRARETGKIERAVMYQPNAKSVAGGSYWDNYSVPLKNREGDIESFIQVARDITEQKRAEEHIHVLSQQLMKAQENERQMISRELHDRIGQDLSSLKIRWDTLLDDQQKVPREIRRKISESSETLKKTIATLRDLAYDLRPPGLDQAGIVQTIFQYCEDFSKKTALKVAFTSAGMDHLRLDSDTDINLYRLVQEGLVNIRKHAEAGNVSIRLVASYPNIILRIEDDGKGFDVKERSASALKEKRMGLRSMEERVSLLEGRMKIQSRPGKGTKVLIEVPYEEKRNES